MNKKVTSKRRVLGVFTLAMINVAIIASLRSLPGTAEFGLTSVTYYTLATLLFFLPVSFVAAELATIWPKTGGVYLWVKEAFGPRWGFLAIWLQWIQNVIWYPTVLSFAAATIAFAFSPNLAKNKYYVLAVILVVYWGATFANFRGMKTSGWISTAGVLAGTIVPGVFLIALGASWYFAGQSSHINFSAVKLIPDFSTINKVALVAAILLAFGGMEVSAVHAREVKNPQRDYPKAILLSAIITLLVFVLGTLAIAAVLPKVEISLTAGLMEAFTRFLDIFNLAFLVPILALLVAFGAMGQVSTWIVGPSKGLLATAQNGDLPPWLQHTNRHSMPTHLMVVQGGIVTALSMVFLFMPGVSSSYWILTALTAQLYLIMYVFMFAAAIRLRYSQPNAPRVFKVPGGNLGMWLLAGVGAVTSLAVIFIGFFPPSQVNTGNILFYEGFLVLGILIMCVTPLVVYHFRNPKWELTPEQRDEEERKAA